MNKPSQAEECHNLNIAAKLQRLNEAMSDGAIKPRNSYTVEVVSWAVKNFLTSLEKVAIRSDTHELQIIRLVIEGLEQRATELYEEGLSKQFPEQFSGGDDGEAVNK